MSPVSSPKTAVALTSVVLDTSVLAPGIVWPASACGRVVRTCTERKVDLVTSEFILDEAARIVAKLAPDAPSHSIRLAMDILMLSSRVVVPSVSAREERLRDETDQLVLRMLLDSGADELVTGDKDLLVLAADYPILSPRAFLDRHRI